MPQLNGYFPINYFPSNYWVPDYWPEYQPTRLKQLLVQMEKQGNGSYNLWDVGLWDPGLWEQNTVLQRILTQMEK